MHGHPSPPIPHGPEERSKHARPELAGTPNALERGRGPVRRPSIKPAQALAMQAKPAMPCDGGRVLNSVSRVAIHELCDRLEPRSTYCCPPLPECSCGPLL